jgi:hypothetical protein
MYDALDRVDVPRVVKCLSLLFPENIEVDSAVQSYYLFNNHLVSSPVTLLAK